MLPAFQTGFWATCTRGGWQKSSPQDQLDTLVLLFQPLGQVKSEEPAIRTLHGSGWKIDPIIMYVLQNIPEKRKCLSMSVGGWYKIYSYCLAYFKETAGFSYMLELVIYIHIQIEETSCAVKPCSREPSLLMQRFWFYFIGIVGWNISL